MRLQLGAAGRIQLPRRVRSIATLSLVLGVSVTALSADKGARPQKSALGPLKTTASLESSGYLDSDHVLVVSPTVAGSVADEVAGWAAGGRYLVDVVSAASVDIVSTASAKWHEIRHVGSAFGNVKLGSVAMGASAIVSSEPDYLSIAGGGTISVDLLNKNVTPFFGFSRGHDSVGRTDLPREFWRSLDTNSFQLGVTFVVNRTTIASLQSEGMFERGYLAKPYRFIPLFAPGQAASIPAGASAADVNRQRRPERPAEQVPSARDRFAVSGRIAHRMTSATFRLDERLYADSWALLASTTDARIMFDVGTSIIFWPHLRFHVQNAVSFWQRAYEVTAGPNGTVGLPSIRVGDRELSPLYTGIAGFGVRWKFAGNSQQSWSLVYELDGGYTHFADALYITERRMVFSTLAVEAEFDR